MMKKRRLNDDYIKNRHLLDKYESDSNYDEVNSLFNEVNKSFTKSSLTYLTKINKFENKVEYIINHEPNILWNNLEIIIPNVNNINLDAVLFQIKITLDGKVFCNIKHNLENQFNALENFFNTNYIYDEDKIILKIGLIHRKLLVTNNNMVISLYFSPNYNQINNIIFNVNKYKIENMNENKFISFNVQTYELEKNGYILANNPVHAIYLTKCHNYNDITNIRLLVDYIEILNATPEEIYKINASNGIYYDGILIVLNHYPLNTHLGTIDMTKIDHFQLLLDGYNFNYTIDVNCLYSKII